MPPPNPANNELQVLFYTYATISESERATHQHHVTGGRRRTFRPRFRGRFAGSTLATQQWSLLTSEAGRMRKHSLLLRLADLDSRRGRAVSLIRQAAWPDPDLVLPSLAFRSNGLAWHAAETEWLDDSAAHQRNLSERVST